MYINIYTDGGCRRDGAGGWGTILVCDTNKGRKTKEISGYRKPTTSNAMELTAVLEGLKALNVRAKDYAITIHSDSRYVINTFSDWAYRWERIGWVRGINEPVKNLELIQEIHRISKELKVKWRWVKSHSGHQFNERADTLAKEAYGRVREC